MSNAILRRTALAAAASGLLVLAACTQAPTAAPPPPPPPQAEQSAPELAGGPTSADLAGGPAWAPSPSPRPVWPTAAARAWMDRHHWAPAPREALVTQRRDDGVTVTAMQPIANRLDRQVESVMACAWKG